VRALKPLGNSDLSGAGTFPSGPWLLFFGAEPSAGDEGVSEFLGVGRAVGLTEPGVCEGLGEAGIVLPTVCLIVGVPPEWRMESTTTPATASTSTAMTGSMI